MQVTIHEAKTQLSKLIAAAERGKEVIISRRDKPVVTNIVDCRLLQELPIHHGDPFDRMLVCQAKRLGLGIISLDKIIDYYQVMRVW